MEQKLDLKCVLRQREPEPEERCPECGAVLEFCIISDGEILLDEGKRCKNGRAITSHYVVPKGK